MRRTFRAFFLLLMTSFLSHFNSNFFLYAETAPSIEDSLNDHKAQVFKVEGSVKVLKSSASDWMEAHQGMMLEVGDQLLTGKASYVQVSYDHRFLNIARIDENTKAEFKNIEPTDLFLEDGSIFSALDGLKGTSYQISTPVVVAAVRGTHFDIAFDAATKKMDVAVIPDHREHTSRVEVIPIVSEGTELKSVMIEEGQQVGMEKGSIETPQALDPARIEASREKLSAMMQDVDPNLRKEGENLLTPESSESKQESSDRKDDDDNQSLPPGGGNDGGNHQGGSEGTEQNTDAKVDAMVDTLIPREEVPASGVEGKIEDVHSGDQRKEHQNSTTEREVEKSPRADFGSTMEFLQTGGAFDSSSDNGMGAGVDPTQLGVVFNNLGFDSKMSDQLATTLGSMFQADGISGGAGAATFMAGPGGVVVGGGMMPPGGNGFPGGPMMGGGGDGFGGSEDGPGGGMMGPGGGGFIEISGMMPDIQSMIQDAIQNGENFPDLDFDPPSFAEMLQAYIHGNFLPQLYHLLDQTTDPGNPGNSYLDSALLINAFDVMNPAGLMEDSHFSSDVVLKVTRLLHDDGAIVNAAPDADDRAGVHYQILHEGNVVSGGAGVVKCDAGHCKD